MRRRRVVFTFDATRDISRDPVIIAARRKWHRVQQQIDKVQAEWEETMKFCSIETAAVIGQLAVLTGQRLGHLDMEQRTLWSDEL